MARVAFIEKIGGPEVIQWHDVELPPPGEGEVWMRNTAVGLNYIDTYHRSGVYPVDLPSGQDPAGSGSLPRQRTRRASSPRWVCRLARPRPTPLS